MIKKITAISLILFFGFAGNVFADYLGDAYRSDVIGEFMIDSGICNSPGAIIFYSSNDPNGYPLFYVSCVNPLTDYGLNTFGEVWGQEQNDQDIYLLKGILFSLIMCTNGTWDYSECSAYNPFRANLTLRADPIIPILTMPETASTDLLGNVGGLFSNFWPIISIMFGVPLSFYIIPKVIALIPK